MKPFDVWPRQAANLAIEEGWLLTNDSAGRVTIARLDDPGSVEGLDFTEPNFETDQAANDFVVHRAMEGSHVHLLAVWLQGHEVDADLQVNPPVAYPPVPPIIASRISKSHG